MKGILFKQPMIKAIINGSKTQTRRVIKPQPASDETMSSGFSLLFHPRYRVGEVVYIKEAWATYRANDDWTIPQIPKTATVFYKLDDPDGFSPIGKWRSPLFMPAWAARYFIKITDVRTERLEEITEDDAQSEGVTRPPNYSLTPHYQQWFRVLWDTINKQKGYGWDDNPWVWVYCFELASP